VEYAPNMQRKGQNMSQMDNWAPMS
jgi:hypothetical protein